MAEQVGSYTRCPSDYSEVVKLDVEVTDSKRIPPKVLCGVPLSRRNVIAGVVILAAVLIIAIFLIVLVSNTGKKPRSSAIQENEKQPDSETPEKLDPGCEYVEMNSTETIEELEKAIQEAKAALKDALKEAKEQAGPFGEALDNFGSSVDDSLSRALAESMKEVKNNMEDNWRVTVCNDTVVDVDRCIKARENLICQTASIKETDGKAEVSGGQTLKTEDGTNVNMGAGISASDTGDASVGGEVSVDNEEKDG